LVWLWRRQRLHHLGAGAWRRQLPALFRARHSTAKPTTDELELAAATGHTDEDHNSECDVCGANLAENTVDKAALNAAIITALSKNEADYTTYSWMVLQGALSAAQTVVASTTATQSQVDSALATLEGALAALEGAPVDDNNLCWLWLLLGILGVAGIGAMVIGAIVMTVLGILAVAIPLLIPDVRNWIFGLFG